MMHTITISDDDLQTVLFALRCGESELLDLTNLAIDNPTSRSVQLIRDYHNMRMTLIRLESRLNPDV